MRLPRLWMVVFAAWAFLTTILIRITVHLSGVFL